MVTSVLGRAAIAAPLLAAALGLLGCGGGSGDPETDGAVPDGTTAPLDGDPGDGPCRADAECDDGSYCNGVEVCDPASPRADERGCVPGEPVDCDDGAACTTDVCDEELRTCTHTPPDIDGDGHGDASCRSGGMALGDDCDDNDANRYPGNAEICNGGDEDCNPDTLGFLDADGDGASSSACCNPTEDGSVVCGPDCNDDDSTIRPGVADGPMMACDNVDNDCDGTADEGCPCVDGRSRECGSPEALDMVGVCAPGEQFCVSGSWTETCTGEVRPEAEFCDGRDNDCDGTADEAVKTTYYRDADGDGYGVPEETAEACSAPEGFSIQSNDCDDANPDIAPTSAEVCDGVDNNCTNGVDEGCDCVDGEVQSCGPDDETGECVLGTQRCAGGVWGTCMGATLPLPESCNGRDDDCDGATDEGTLLTYYADADGDGFGDASLPDTGCSVPANASRLDTDCDDTDGAINPAATERCDGVDNDCDTTVDPGCDCTSGETRSCGEPDGSGGIVTTGACEAGTQRCVEGLWAECVGAVTPTSEICNGADDDCDGAVDDDGVTASPCYLDGDSDGYGAGSATTQCTDPARTAFGGCPSGYTDTAGDCNDGNALTHPGSTEACDGVDNDCDGTVDEGCDCISGEREVCGPEFTEGVCRKGERICVSGTWSSCDGAIFSSPETCNGVDDDCDGTTDEGLKDTYYYDFDGDGYGTSESKVSCGPEGNYRATMDGDCDDGKDYVYPGAPELCNGIDDDCDGSSAGEDEDNDGFLATSVSCSDGFLDRLPRTDCADTDPLIHPDATESCDGIDNDCDGMVDGAVACNYPVQTAAGEVHTCVLRTRGDVWCTGDHYGLGDGSTADRGTFGQVPFLGEATHVASGQFFSCATLVTGEAKCWGEGKLGKLGNGGELDSLRPTSVEGLFDLVQIGCGRNHACAISASTGQVSCWGANGDGQLGNNAGSGYETRPVEVRHSEWSLGDFDGMVQISIGDLHGCALHSSGHVFCWGGNWEGQAGDGTKTEADSAVQTVFADGTPLVAAEIAATAVTHSCARTDAGTVYCWGDNLMGQLGRDPATVAESLEPLQVPGISDAVEIDVGAYHTCVTRATGDVICFGANWAGQLGDGSTDSTHMLVGAEPLDGVTELSSWGDHNCALSSSASEPALYCWGSSTNGQLGNGVVGGPGSYEPTPTLISLPTP